MRYQISPEYKKSLVERQIFTKDGKTITEECRWRWGSFTCESDELPVIEEGAIYMVLDTIWNCKNVWMAMLNTFLKVSQMKKKKKCRNSSMKTAFTI